jgi:Flp pilus assembly protein TadD
VKATKQPDSRICPNCGARNKAKWEYCVSCSEPLAGVPTGDEAAASVIPPTSAPDEGENAFPWKSLLATAAALGVAVWIYQAAREPAAAPPPELFSIGTLPPSLPPPMVAATRDPGEEDYQAGVKLLNRGDPGGAAALFARAASAASGNHLYRHALAVALWQSGSKVQALDEYGEAVRMSPSNPTYRLNYAKALAVSGRKTEAAAQYEELIRNHGGHVDALLEAAEVIAESDPARARDMLRRASAARPSDVVLKQQLATVLERAGDSEGASETYKEILGTHPEAHITRGLLAEIQIKHGQPAEAVSLFRAGIEQYPGVPLLHRGLASALERSGAMTEAITQYREYVRLAPNAPDAQQLRERADRLEKQVTASAS